MTDCGHTECPTHGIGIAMNGHGLAFEKPIEVYLHLNIDGEQRAVFVGRAYQNPHGYFAQTDAGIMPATGIEDALALINQHINMEGRGLRRIDPPAAIVQMDEDKTKRVYDAAHSEEPDMDLWISFIIGKEGKG